MTFESIFDSFVVGLLRVPSGKSKKNPCRELCLWICVAWQALKDLLASSKQIKLAHLHLENLSLLIRVVLLLVCVALLPKMNKTTKHLQKNMKHIKKSTIYSGIQYMDENVVLLDVTDLPFMGYFVGCSTAPGGTVPIILDGSEILKKNS